MLLLLLQSRVLKRLTVMTLDTASPDHYRLETGNLRRFAAPAVSVEWQKE